MSQSFPAVAPFTRWNTLFEFDQVACFRLPTKGLGRGEHEAQIGDECFAIGLPMYGLLMQKGCL